MSIPASQNLLRRRAAFRSALMRWYDANRRPLPWRESPSLYKTVVSEFMLQQTQVATVLPYFERWLLRLPDFAALARAPEDDVIKLWEGLGYYSRARNLRRLAIALEQMPDMPVDADEWRRLPGVGPYTAAAIASIACGQPEAVVDGNVIRILSRLTADGAEYRDNAAAVSALSPLAASLLNPRRPGDHNQAMMELGATVCARRAPRCAGCPVRRLCAANAAGTPENFPRLRRKGSVPILEHRLWLIDGRKVLLHRLPAESGRLAGLYELPRARDLLSTLPERPTLVKRRAITNHRITERIYAVPLTPRLRRRIRASAHLRWLSPRALSEASLSGPHRRWVSELLKDGKAQIEG